MAKQGIICDRETYYATHLGMQREGNILSTILPAQLLPSGRLRIVNSYDKKKIVGFDQTDELMTVYASSGQRKHKKAWKGVMLSLFVRILYNAYIRYQNNISDTPVNSRVKFIQEVFEE